MMLRMRMVIELPRLLRIMSRLSMQKGCQDSKDNADNVHELVVVTLTRIIPSRNSKSVDGQYTAPPYMQNRNFG